MQKQSLILKYFQKADQLTVKNKFYCKTITSLFNWLTESDRIKDDQTTRLFTCHPRPASPKLQRGEPDRESFKIPAFATSDVAFAGMTKAGIIAREKLIMAGMEEIAYLLNKYTHLSLSVKRKDSAFIKENQIVAEITGSISEILAYERTILNILQRLSGIATETDRLTKSLKTPRGWQAERREAMTPPRWRKQRTPFIAATRKTPWMALDKKAVAVGGGLTHRLSLADGILIKDNHLSILKKEYRLKNTEEAIVKAIQTILRNGNKRATKTRSARWPASKDSPEVEGSKLIEIEVETEKQAYEAIRSFQPFNHSSHLAILLDNFQPPQVKNLLSGLGDLYDLSSIIFEASGGITKENISEWTKTGVDILSLGSLTHSPTAANFSLEIT